MPARSLSRPAGFLLLALAASAGASSDAAATTIRLQAEAAEIVRGLPSTASSGYSGTGFVAYAPEAGSYVEWLVDVAAPTSTAKIAFRFANGGSTSRKLKLVVNGTPLAGTFQFAPTGGWSTWKNRSASGVALRQGLNTIRAEATTANGGPSLDRLDLTSDVQVMPVDWAQAVIRSTMVERYPDPATLGPGTTGPFWRYQSGLYLLGQYRAYQRTGDAAYLDYIRRWVDVRTDPVTGTLLAATTVDPAINHLDTILPGRVALLLDAAFGGDSGTPRYRLTADQLWSGLARHRRTPDGIFWHTNSAMNSVLLDGAYMALPFATEYGGRFGQALPGTADVYRDAASQLVRHRHHLQDVAGTEIVPTRETGLFYHAYDLEGNGATDGIPWSQDGAKHSPVIWCRAMGWYAMTLVDVLATLPADASHDVDRAALIEILRSLMDGLAARQSGDGRWLTVMDFPAGPVAGNFLDTSCSAMFVYAISKAIVAQHLDASYARVASRGHQGVLRQLTLQPETIAGVVRHLTSLAGIAAGQLVRSTPELYTTTTLNAARAVVPRVNPLTNDLHGLGSFLLMYEQVKRFPQTVSPF